MRPPSPTMLYTNQYHLAVTHNITGTVQNYACTDRPGISPGAGQVLHLPLNLQAVLEVSYALNLNYTFRLKLKKSYHTSFVIC